MRHTRPMQRNVPPHGSAKLSSKYLRLQRTPSGPPAKAKHLHTEAAGSCQEKRGSLRATWAGAKEAGRLVGSSPPTHTLHSQRTLRLKGSVQGRHEASSDLEGSGASGVPRHSAKQTSDLSIRKCPLSPRVCGAPSMRCDPAWRELSLAGGTPAERCTRQGRESGPGRARRSRRGRRTSAGRLPGADAALARWPCGDPVCLSRGPGVPHSQRSAAPTCAGSTEPERGLTCYQKLRFEFGVRMGKTPVSCFQVEGGDLPSFFRPLPARQGEEWANEERTSRGGDLSPLMLTGCHAGGRGLLLLEPTAVAAHVSLVNASGFSQ